MRMKMIYHTPILVKGNEGNEFWMQEFEFGILFEETHCADQWFESRDQIVLHGNEVVKEIKEHHKRWGASQKVVLDSINDSIEDYGEKAVPLKVREYLKQNT